MNKWMENASGRNSVQSVADARLKRMWNVDALFQISFHRIVYIDFGRVHFNSARIVKSNRLATEQVAIPTKEPVSSTHKMDFPIDFAVSELLSVNCIDENFMGQFR